MNPGDEVIAILDAFPVNIQFNNGVSTILITKGTRLKIKAISNKPIYNTKLLTFDLSGLNITATPKKEPCYYASSFQLYEGPNQHVPVWYTITK